MVLRGHFDGKVVVLDEPPPPEWGPDKEVNVVAVSAKNGPAESDAAEHKKGDISELLLRMAASAKPGLPPDLSENHDRYIHRPTNE